jgi:hypothetical protein
MAFDIKEYVRDINNPYGLSTDKWDELKAGYEGWKKSRLSGLAAQERNARARYANFTNQARDQLTQAVGQLKTAVGRNALARGLSRSTIPGAVIGAETGRMNEQYAKQDAAAQSGLAQAVGVIKRNRKQL